MQVDVKSQGLPDITVEYNFVLTVLSGIEVAEEVDTRAKNAKPIIIEDSFEPEESDIKLEVRV